MTPIEIIHVCIFMQGRVLATMFEIACKIRSIDLFCQKQEVWYREINMNQESSESNLYLYITILGCRLFLSFKQQSLEYAGFLRDLCLI